MWKCTILISCVLSMWHWDQKTKDLSGSVRTVSSWFWKHSTQVVPCQKMWIFQKPWGNKWFNVIKLSHRSGTTSNMFFISHRAGRTLYHSSSIQRPRHAVDRHMPSFLRTKRIAHSGLQKTTQKVRATVESKPEFLWNRDQTRICCDK